MSEITTEQLNKKIPRVWNKTISKMMCVQVKGLVQPDLLYRGIEVKSSFYNNYYGQVEIVCNTYYHSMIGALEKMGYEIHTIKPTEDCKKLRIFIHMEFDRFRRMYLGDDLI